MSLLTKPVRTYLGLADTPGSYSDQAGKYSKVNVGEDALEFAAVNGGGIVEGDYTSWKWKWTKDFTDGLYVGESFWTFIDEANEVLNVLWTDGSENDRFGIYNLSDFSDVFESDSGADYVIWKSDLVYSRVGVLGLGYVQGGGASRSIQSYVAISRADEHTIEVWRGGSLWTHDVHDDIDTFAIRALEISPSGKWLLAVLYYGLTYGRLVLYEGT